MVLSLKEQISLAERTLGFNEENLLQREWEKEFNEWCLTNKKFTLEVLTPRMQQTDAVLELSKHAVEFYKQKLETLKQLDTEDAVAVEKPAE